MSESEAGQVWKAMREARVRSLYFGEMHSRYAKRRQWVRGLSLGLSSGAVVANVREPWPEVAAALAGVVAIANAWSIATNLDEKIETLGKLMTAWEALRIEYSDLWSGWYEDGAQERFRELQRRGGDLGSLASSAAPWDREAIARWEAFVDSDHEADG